MNFKIKFVYNIIIFVHNTIVWYLLVFNFSKLDPLLYYTISYQI